MLRNCLAAALRHLERHRVFTAIGVLGLSVGLCAALLATLVVRSELSWDHFISDHERIYAAMSVVTPPGRATVYMSSTSNFIGPQIKLRSSGVEAVTRLALQSATLRRGSTSLREQIYWADANAFEVLAMPVVAGDPHAALVQPDSLVLTRAMARKYFGAEAPLGQTLELDGHPMRVGAVVEDLPSQATHLASGIFAPGVAPWSFLQHQDRINLVGAPVGFGVNTYLRLAPGTSIDALRATMPAMVDALFEPSPQGWKVGLELTRLDRLHVHPGLNPSIAGKLTATLLLGVVILLVALVNFANLLAARAGGRAMEVGVRKLAGASRPVLVLQFIGETMFCVLLAGLLSVALVEWLLPHANAFLDTGATFRYWHEEGLLVACALTVVVLGVLVGGSPALLLARLRPLLAMRTGGILQGGKLFRQGLVTLQFAILIALLIAAGVVRAQRDYATHDALRVNTDEVLILRAPCRAPLRDGLRQMAGVLSVACSAGGTLNEPTFMTPPDREGVQQYMFYVPVQPEFFALYDVRPVAGEMGPGGIRDAATFAPAFAINETAARRLGFARPADAVGFKLPSLGRASGPTLNVIAVVPDFSLTSVEQKIEATGYIVTATDVDFSVINLKLGGNEIPETLAAIDGLWKRLGNAEKLNRFFVSEYLQRLYLAMGREAQAFGAFAIVAFALGALGLLALAAAVAGRRQREIGIRKALGARTSDVTRLLLWEFARPVLWANLIAWPVAGWLMQRWLHGYAYHVDLPLWLFPAAGGAALAMALTTVAAHALRAARAKPATALRYE